MEAKT
jgi:hypothetical protein